MKKYAQSKPGMWINCSQGIVFDEYCQTPTMRDRRPIPTAFQELLEPVKPYVGNEPIEKEELIERCAGHVDGHVLNFIKRFTFFQISKVNNDELIIV